MTVTMNRASILPATVMLVLFFAPLAPGQSKQLWPEIEVYVNANSTMRLYFSAASNGAIAREDKQIRDGLFVSLRQCWRLLEKLTILPLSAAFWRQCFGSNNSGRYHPHSHEQMRSYLWRRN